MNSLLIATTLVKRSFRNKKELIGLVILPVLIIGAIAFFMAKATATTTPIGIVNLDKGILGDRVLKQFEQQPGLEILTLESTNYQGQLNNGKIDAVLLIPENFSSDIETGRKTRVDLYANQDGVTPQRVKQIANDYTLALYQATNLTARLMEQSDKPKVEILNNVLDNIAKAPISATYRSATADNANSALFSTIGFTVTFIMMLVFTSMGAIMEDKKRLTLARMYVSAVKEWEIIAGNLLGSLFLGLIQLIPLTLLIKLVFHIPWGLGLGELFLVLSAFLLATLGLGIGLSGIIKNHFNPTMIGATIIFPTSILGGCFIPDNMLPQFLNTIGWAVPQKWVMDAVQQLSHGSGIQAIAPNLGILLMFGLAFSTFGLKTIRPLKDA